MTTVHEAIDRACAEVGCESRVKTRGLCNAHYKKLLRYGATKGRHASPGEPLSWIHSVALNFEGDDCLSWPFANAGNGYGRVLYEGKTWYPHRLLCFLVHGAPPEHFDASHSCGNGSEGCVNPRHLIWKSRRDNLADKLKHGTHNRGSQHYAAKLTKNDVLYIRSEGLVVSNSKLANLFNVTPSAIAEVKNRRAWNWL